MKKYMILAISAVIFIVGIVVILETNKSEKETDTTPETTTPDIDDNFVEPMYPIGKIPMEPIHPIGKIPTTPTHPIGIIPMEPVNPIAPIDQMPLHLMSPKQLALEYQRATSNAYPNCSSYTSYLFPNGLKNETGNKNWFNKLTTKTPLVHTPVIVGESGNVYAFKGQLENSRYIASGVTLWSNNSSQAIYDNITFQEKLINNLLGVSNFKDENLVVWSEDSKFNQFFMSQITDANITFVTGEDKNKGIENIKFDLFIGYKTNVETMEKVIAKGAPVIITYNKNWGASNTANMFDLSYHTVSDFEDFVVGEDACKFSDSFLNTSIMLDYLANEKFVVNETTMPSDTVSGKNASFSKIIDPATNKSLSEIFRTPLNDLRSEISYYDGLGVNILNHDGLRHLQIPIYMADKFRNDIDYKGYRFYADIHGSASEVDYNEWFRTYFTDLSTHYARPDNKLNNDLGEFSPNEAKVQQLSTINKQYEYDLTTSSHVTAIGAYAKAGQPTTIKRTDNHTGTVKIYINYQRDGATNLFGTGSGKPYNRPAFDRSHGVSLEAGEEITISSPIGGVLFAQVPSNSAGDKISLELKNVLQNPSISGVSSADIAQFERQLDNTPFNWITVITKEIQIHSLSSKFEQTMDEYNNNVEKFMSDIVTYSLGNFGYAGYLSNILPDHTNSIKQFCSELGISDLCSDKGLNSRTNVQHIYVDRPTCGNLCSGVPVYDRASKYLPGDWGDSHEIGHNLQPNKLKIYNRVSMEVSNNIFPVESRRRKAVENSDDYYDARANHSKMFDKMVEGYGYVGNGHPFWSSGLFERLGFYNQLQFTSNDIEFYTKMYLMQRIGEKQDSNETSWNEVKDGLGFSSYTASEFKDMNGNDFMAVASSKINQKNMIPFFEGFGIEITDKAKTQIALENYSSQMSAGMYYVPSDNSTNVPTNFVSDTTKDKYFIELTANAVYADPTK